MITYQNAIHDPEAFAQAFGYSVAEFDQLYTEFEIASNQRVAHSMVTRREGTPRKRKPGAGRHFKHPLKERLLLALFWRRANPTLELLGDFFALDKSSAGENLKDVMEILRTLPSFTLEPPDRIRRKVRTLQQVQEAFPGVIRMTASEHDFENPSSPTFE